MAGQTNEATPSVMRYATLFTTYTWDEFVARQYARIADRVHGGDLYIMADETGGPLEGLPAQRVIRTTQDEILHHGGRTPYVENGHWETKGPLWWNLDYLVYRFFDDHQEYDYCVMMDYDACINQDVDTFVRQVAADGYDFVALPAAKSMADWFWQKPHQPIYPGGVLNAHLLCVLVISRAAANYLARRRLEMGRDYAAGKIKFWPFCEAFMPTELQLGGFRVGSIAQFGNTEKLGWAQVHRETDVAAASCAGFIHPVMDDKRFLPAFTRRYQPISDWVKPRSPLWKQLRRYPFRSYAPYLWSAIVGRLVRGARQRLKKGQARAPAG